MGETILGVISTLGFFTDPEKSQRPIGFHLLDRVDFCTSGCEIHLYGCQVGKGPEGDTLKKFIENKTKCTLYAEPCDTQPGPNGFPIRKD